MRKTIIVLGILLTTLLLAGCSSQNTTDSNSSEDTMLTEQEAKQIALSKVPGATEEDISKFKKDMDDSVPEYEGEIHYNGMEYEFEINAYDGTILEWDEEPLTR